MFELLRARTNGKIFVKFSNAIVASHFARGQAFHVHRDVFPPYTACRSYGFPG